MFTFPVGLYANGIPTKSLEFDGSTDYLSMSDTNFGAFNLDKFAISVYGKRDTTGTIHNIMSQGFVGGDLCFRLNFNASDKLDFFTSSDGSSIDGRLITTATYTGSDFYHILVHADLQNATAGDRLKMWVDGSEVTVFDTDTNPPQTTLFDSSQVVRIGAAASPTYDGLLYQVAFFSGELPSISSVYSASGPVDVSSVAGIYSLLDAVTATNDAKLATDWTNNGSVTLSTIIP